MRWDACVIGTSGRRTSASHRPSRDAAYFTGPGFELAEHRIVQRHEAILQRQRGPVVAGKAGVLEFGTHARSNIRNDRNAAVAPVRHEAQGRGVLARQHHEVGAHRRPLLRSAREIGGRVLDADYVLQCEAARHGVDAHVDHRAARYVVDHDGDVDRIVDSLEMLVEPFLGRLVVIGRDNQHRRGTDLLGVAREVDRFARRVRAGAGDHRRAPLGGLDRKLNEALMLLMRQRRALACRANRHETVRALTDLPLDDTPEGVLVEAAVSKRCDQRRE